MIPLSFAILIAVMMMFPAAHAWTADTQSPAGAVTTEHQVTPMGLDESVRFALENSPLLKARDFQRKASHQGVRQAQARLGFNMDSRYTYTRQGPVIAFGGRQVSPDFRNDMNVFITHPIWSPSLNAAKGLAQVASQIAEYDYDAERLQIIFETTIAYLDVLRAQSLLTVSEKSVEANKERLRIAETMFKTGASPRFDVLRADVQLAAARERLASANNALELMKSSFNNVLGRNVETPVALKEVPRDQTPVPDLTDSLEMAVASRPELASTQKQISLAAQKERVARAGDLPTLSVQSSYNRQPATAFSKNFRYDALFVVSLPVFDSGLSRYEAKQARQERRAAQSLTQDRRLRIELEVKQAILNIEDARLRIDVNAKAISQAEEALRIANLRYQTRLAPIIEVLDAEVALTQARNNEINAWFDYEQAKAQWRRAVGEMGEFEVPNRSRGASTKTLKTNPSSAVGGQEVLK